MAKSITAQTITVAAQPEPGPGIGATYHAGISDTNSPRTGQSSKLRQPVGQAFTILDSDTAEAVRGRQSQIEQLGLEDASGRLLVAQLYVTNGLAADALGVLVKLSDRPGASG
jgi:hypothetical protein